MSGNYSNSVTPRAMAGLSRRSWLRWMCTGLVLACIALGIAPLAWPTEAPLDWMWLLLLALYFCAVVLDLYLINAACPHCGASFTPPSFLNWCVFPSPMIFVSRCASCGVSLRGELK